MNNKCLAKINGSASLKCWALLLLTVFGSAAQAEDVFVTDMLQLEMYATSEISGAPIRRLRSGDRLELIEERGRYLNVRAEDGLVGWVKSLYIVKKEPARTRVNKLEKDYGELEATVKKLRTELDSERAKLAKFRAEQSGSIEAREAIQEELDRLRSDNADMTDKLASYGSSVPVSWLLLAVLLALGGGIAAGWFWIDSRSRSRHGGYRIY
jgi:SH3 domain protein